MDVQRYRDPPNGALLRVVLFESHLDKVSSGTEVGT